MATPPSISVVPLVAQTSIEPEKIVRLLRGIELGDLLAAAAIIAVAYLINSVVGSLLDRIGEGAAKRRLTTKKVATFVRLGIFLVTFYLVVVTLLEGQQQLLIGLGGTLAVAAGLALKDTVSSIVAGVMILVDEPFQVGDRVDFGETYGEVIEMGLRSVRIRTLDGEEVSIPNNRFLSDRISSVSAGTLHMMKAVDFDIAITEDAELAKRLVYETCATSRYVYLEKPVSMRVGEVKTAGGLAVRITCKAYIIDARYEKDYVTDVSERVKDAFRERGIQRPYFREYMVQEIRRGEERSGEDGGSADRDAGREGGRP